MKKNIIHKVIDRLFKVSELHIPCVEEELQRDGIELVASNEVAELIQRHDGRNISELDYGRKLLCKDGQGYVAVDNATGNCFTEKFKSLDQAYAWLKGDMKGDLYAD